MSGSRTGGSVGRTAAGSDRSLTSALLCQAGAGSVLPGCASLADSPAPQCASGVRRVVLCRARGRRGLLWWRPQRSQAMDHPSALGREACEPIECALGPSPAWGSEPSDCRGCQGPPGGAARSGLHIWRLPPASAGRCLPRSGPQPPGGGGMARAPLRAAARRGESKWLPGPARGVCALTRRGGAGRCPRAPAGGPVPCARRFWSWRGGGGAGADGPSFAACCWPAGGRSTRRVPGRKRPHDGIPRMILPGRNPSNSDKGLRGCRLQKKQELGALLPKESARMPRMSLGEAESRFIQSLQSSCS